MRAYERLLEYVKVKTPSSEENMETPSSSCQFKLAEPPPGHPPGWWEK